MTIFRTLVFASFIPLLVYLLVFFQSPAQAAQTTAAPVFSPQHETAKASDLAHLNVGGDSNYPPYEYLNRKGQPEGFNIDIIQAVARAMGLAIRIELGPWNEMMSQLEHGEIDVLMGMFNTVEREKKFDFSIPHFIASYAVFVRNASPIRSLEDARDTSILVQLNDLGHDYIVEQQITNRIITKNDWQDVLKALAAGEGDCAIVSRLQGTRLAGRLGITNIKAVGPPIIQRKYCLAVTDGNSSLLAKLNEGLSIIKESGEYDEIYRKWFGVYEEPFPLLAKTVKYLIWITIPLLVLALAGFLWSWSLKKRVRAQTIDLQKQLIEQRRIEEELRASNALLSLFIKHSPIYAFIKDVSPTESRVLTASENYLDMVGIPGSQMAGKTMSEIFPAEFAAKIIADDWQVVANGKTLLLDEEMNGRSYTTIKFPIRLGEKHLLAGYTIDITERIRTEEELRKRENQLQKIFKILPIGLWFTDKDGTLLRGNAMGMQIWGVRQDMPYPSYTALKVYRPHSGQQITIEERALSRTLRQGVTVMDELLEIEALDGKRKTILNSTTPLLNDNGNIEGAVLVNLDISDRQALELQLVEAQKMESIGRLAGGVAHDFNNMLSVILGHAELALANLAPEDPLSSSLRNIHKAAEQSANLTRQLLAFARKQTVAPKVLDLNTIVEGMFDMLRRLIGERIELVWQPGTALDPVKIDPSQIHQILVNLCVNARDAIADIGNITIETATVSFDSDYCARHQGTLPGNYTMLAVSDNGKGIAQGVMSHIFEPFYTTKERGKGTGLGLATVYGIVKQNNGFINVYSEPGIGTTFKMYLPIAAEQIDHEENHVDSTLPGRETVLLVEDDPMIVDLATTMLENLGYTVVAASTPDEALGLAEEYAGIIHLLMTDVILPRMNGRDLAARILRVQPEMKVLFMSGYTANVIAHHGVLEKGVQFIQKPFSLALLSQKLRDALQVETVVV